MDQVKDFLRQCVKYRFWIAFGVSLLLPMIGYLVGSGAMIATTETTEKGINTAKTDIQKYQAGRLPNNDYKRFTDEKKAVLTADVDTTWRKLYQLQEPLLKWPDVVEEKFRKWGRKWPENVDAGQVRQAIIDYTFAYPEFVSRVYQTHKPWNPEDGTGIVLSPDLSVLMRPAPFISDNPPELTKVWSEQERLWVLTALLDVIAKVNGSAKDWETATVKQILTIEVGSQLAQDQKSLAQGTTLEAAAPLNPEGTPPPPPPAAGTLAAPGGGPGGNNASADVLYFKALPQQPYKILPIMMKVYVDQDKLPDFLIGLENSPMAIQVMEPEINKPSSPVVKPVYGETTSGMSGFGSPRGGGTTMPGAGGEMTRMPGGMKGGLMPPPGGNAGRPGAGGDMPMGAGGVMRPGSGGRPGNNGPANKGTDQHGVNKAEIRKQNSAASKAKTAPKKNFDQYYNVIEVTVYGQARFYNTPPAAPATEPSKAQEPPAPTPLPAASPEPPKAEAPKAEAPKAEAPKAEASKAEAPEAETPKPEAPKPDAPAPKAEGTPPKP